MESKRGVWQRGNPQARLGKTYPRLGFIPLKSCIHTITLHPENRNEAEKQRLRTETKKSNKLMIYDYEDNDNNNEGYDDDNNDDGWYDSKR